MVVKGAKALRSVYRGLKLIPFILFLPGFFSVASHLFKAFLEKKRTESCSADESNVFPQLLSCFLALFASVLLIDLVCFGLPYPTRGGWIHIDDLEISSTGDINILRYEYRNPDRLQHIRPFSPISPRPCLPYLNFPLPKPARRAGNNIICVS